MISPRARRIITSAPASGGVVFAANMYRVVGSKTDTVSNLSPANSAASM
jgi:hypothetical protein